ncbi:hypothetical protein AAHE18_16G091600 [Arachis hypogaea]
MEFHILQVLRLQKGHKFCLLGRLSSEVGWNYYDTITPLCLTCTTKLSQQLQQRAESPTFLASTRMINCNRNSLSH